MILEYYWFVYVSSLRAKIKGFRCNLMFTDRNGSFFKAYFSMWRSLVYLILSVSKGRSGETIDRLREKTHTLTRWALLINIYDTWPKATLWVTSLLKCSLWRHNIFTFDRYNDRWTICFVILTISYVIILNIIKQNKKNFCLEVSSVNILSSSCYDRALDYS